MKVLYFSIFLLVSYSSSACQFRDVSSPELPQEILGLNPDSCFSPQFASPPNYKENHCSCINQQAEKFDFGPEESDLDRFRLAAISKLKSKIDKSTLVLGNRMAVMEGDLFNENREIGQNCRQLLHTDLQNFSCPNGDTALTPEQIRETAKSFYQSATARANELLVNNQITCDGNDVSISAAEMLDIRSSSAPGVALILKEIVMAAPLELRNSAKSFQELMDNNSFFMALSTNPDLALKYARFNTALDQHPVLSELLKNSELFNQFKSGETLNYEDFSESLNQVFSEKTASHCSSLKTQITNLLCTSSANALMPNDYDEYSSLVRSMIPDDSGVELEELNYFRHKTISEVFCSETSNYYNLIEDAAYSFYPQSSNDLKSDTFDPVGNLNEQLERDKELLCPYLPPPEEKWTALEQRIQECNPSGDDQATPISYECLMLETLHAKMAPTREQIAEEIRTELSLTSSGLDESELEDQIEQRLANLSSGDLLPNSGPQKILKYFSTTAEQPNTPSALAATSETPSPTDGGGEPATGGRQPASVSSGSSGGSGEAPGGSAASFAPGSFNSEGPEGNTAFNSPPSSPGVDSTAEAERQRRTQDLFDRVRDRLERSDAAITETDPVRRRQRRLESLTPGVTIPDRVSTSSDNVLAANNSINSPINGRTEDPTWLDNTTRDLTRDEQMNAALNEINQKREESRRPASSRPSPIGISGFGNNTLATEIPELLTSGAFDQDLEAALTSDPEDAQELLDLLESNPKTITITHKDNPQYQVQITREGDRYIIKKLGNEAEGAYQEFVASIERALGINQREENTGNPFRGIINRLRSYLGQIEIESEPTAGSAYSDLILD